jgi:hypothetical protein
MIHPDNSATIDAGDRHMAKAKLRFTERDVSRAIRAASKAGVEVGRVDVDTTGTISVFAAQPGDREPISLFELERRRRHLEPGEGTISDNFPKLPATSPWSSDPVGDEPTINREEDRSHG